MPPRTIDNLGMEASTRYAQDQTLLDTKLLKESKAIPPQTEVDVTSPAFASEFDLLFGVSKKNVPWAAFFIPSKYNEQKKRLFTFQIIPSLGSQDKKEGLVQKLLAKIQEKEEEKEKKRDWEEARKKNEKERQKKVLTNLLNCILQLDRDIVDINAKRSQYQKG